MTSSATSAEQPDVMFTPRRRDRRTGVGGLVIALTRALGERADVSLMRGALEETLRRMLPVRSIHLRDNAARSCGRGEVPGAGESVAFEVPGPLPSSRGVLEAHFGPGSALGEWDLQVLGVAAHVAALVLEIERGRLQLARAGIGGSGGKAKRDPVAALIGSTSPVHALRARIARVAKTDFTILVEGESGVGKELVARHIHELSQRRDGPFVAINCAALVETLFEAELFGIEERTATGVKGRRGKFEHADAGTLFLDEVSDLSLSAQAKLLRAIQDLSVERVGATGAHRVDIRIIAATNRSLSGLVEQGLFRADLYYRLSGVEVRVPPLRDRRDDILELARYFLAQHRATRVLRLSPEASGALMEYGWPGNVRELERVIERTVALAESDVIELDDLPADLRGEFAARLLPSLRRNDTMRAWGSRYARLVLDRCGGNKRQASRALGISYHTLAGYLQFPVEAAAGAGASWKSSDALPSTEVAT